MVETPTVDSLDVTAVLGAVTVLLVAYGLLSDARLRYLAWLIVFTIWMGWFVYFGTKWMYGIGDEGAERSERRGDEDRQDLVETQESQTDEEPSSRR